MGRSPWAGEGACGEPASPAPSSAEPVRRLNSFMVCLQSGWSVRVGGGCLRSSAPFTASLLALRSRELLPSAGGHLPDDERSVGNLLLDVIKLLLALFLLPWRATSARRTCHQPHPSSIASGRSLPPPPAVSAYSY